MSGTDRFPHRTPLTGNQELMWIGQRLHPASALYNMPFVFTINGAVDPEMFQRAFAALVMSSENLRTVIVEQGGTPYQQVLDRVPSATEFIDLSGEANPDAALAAWLDVRRARQMPPGSCLYDSVLVEPGDDRYVWFLNLHHIVIDVTTTKILFERMSDIYAHMESGTAFEPEPLPRYADYVAFEQEIRESERFARASAFWDERLSVPTEPVNLYGEPDTGDATHTERVPFPLTDAQAEALAQIATEPGIRSFTPQMTYANIFAALMLAALHRLTGNEVVRLGTPLANRSNKPFGDALGLFIEVLSLQVEFDDDETFRSLVKKAAAANIQTLQNLMPGISTAAHNNAYEAILNFITVTFGDFAGRPTKTAWIHSGYNDSQHKIRLQVHDLNATGRYDLAFDMNTRVFSEADRARFIDHFGRVLDACVNDPDTPLHSIRLLDDDEWQRNIVDFNATAAEYPAQQTVVDLFEAQAAQTPQSVAVQMGENTLTYAELNRHANRLAAQLQGRGVGPDVCVPVCMAQSMETVIALLAVLKAGGGYVPIDPNHPDGRILMLLDDIGDVPVVLGNGALSERIGRDVLTVDARNAVGEVENPVRAAAPEHLAYMIYTSGTTGKPKGVMVEHRNLMNYLWWAKAQYVPGEPLTFALYSALAFDLTVTSIYVPLITGGAIRVYPDTEGNGMLIREVFADNAVDVVKLTPSHLALVRDMDLQNTRIKTLIVGGEDFKTELARHIHQASGGRIAQFNEYGPTEATVACMIHRYDPNRDTRPSVPIGTPSDNMRVYVLDSRLQPTPTGMIGEMVVAGDSVARGYHNRDELTAERFLPDPFTDGGRMYRTGDLARWLPGGEMAFLGRNDHQVKVGGVRIELGEVEAALLAHPAVKAAVIDVRGAKAAEPDAAESLTYCTRCGLASNYPGVTYNADGVCSICDAYDDYREKAQSYFHDMDEFKTVAERIKSRSSGDYDCVALLSGGKDSTYMLHGLVEHGLRVLTFTLDNGYISDGAKANIRRATDALGVEHVWGETPFMNEIFVDSLHRYANVCNGCFKTIYTLAIDLAREKGIGTIVTGLSRGQFFETRLTPELFTGDDFDPAAIDASIERARRAYHQRDDIISRSLDVDVFRAESALDEIEFVDFYRYCDVDLSDLYDFLSTSGLWERPDDTGRSTNCLINDAGIYIHKKKRGFHNYALPYSWDVRMGHKTREEAMDELDDDLDEPHIRQMLREIGYTDTGAEGGQQRLVAYYTTAEPVTAAALREALSSTLPSFMVPSHFVELDAMPLGASGKIDRKALPAIDADRQAQVSAAYAPPEDEVQEALTDIWQSVMHMERIGVHDNFFELGGHSLPAIRIVSRINEAFEIDFPLDQFFANPTIAEQAAAVDDVLLAEIEALSDEDVQRLLEEGE